jgi:GLPGLI family protein
LIFRDFYPLAGEFKPCVVNDSTASMKWTFTAKTMRIGNYMCRSATTDFRGRHYEAWYTEEIPIMFGPWKLFGLPGAIVKVESKDGIIRFLLTHLVSQQEEVIHRPSQGHAISMKEYVRIRRESINDFIATLKSKLPRGAEVTVNTTGDYNLETDFSDVKK